VRSREATQNRRVDGRFYILRVRACDDAQEPGRGTITRAVIGVGRFMAKFQGVNQ